MTQAVASAARRVPRAPVFIVGALTVWFVLVLALGLGGRFVRPPGTPPLPIAFGFVIPLAGFAAAYGAFPAFRELVLRLDLRLATALQAWRFAGLGFIALYAHGILPGSFAWPAGLGDMTIAAFAPWLILALIRRPAFAGSRRYVIWNLAGILDLLVAVGSGVLNAIRTDAAAPSTAPMATLPLVLIPVYLVPLFMMLHVAALLQARRLRASARSA